MIDLKNKTFGRLTVLDLANTKKHGRYWKCLCSCGAVKTILQTKLRNGHTKSCGCLQREFAKTLNKIHGKSNTPLHIMWKGMLNRCYGNTLKNSKNYKNRGITVCERWHKFENFVEDMGDRPFEGATLDRINNDGNYCKENCRWATRSEQRRNASNTRFLTYQSRTQSMIAWAEELKIPYNALQQRITTLKWSVEKAFTYKGR